MSHWGFPQTDDPIWKEQYAELTERERVFYWEGLPRILRTIHIGVVCKRSIPYIVDRLSQFEPGLWEELADVVRLEKNLADPGIEDVQMYLRRFAGFYLLIPTLDNHGYARVVLNSLTSMGLTTHQRLLNWDISEIRSEVQLYMEQRRASRSS